ncbi:NAD(P)H-dependent oxidoreductase [Brucepastera parasyntrophica]|uniref:NAD(P)H-dependent oxidoreductase n=1 Tax=Brucepastera parasyntrophica TaxID=2880008 RepID=UPI00210AE496|nr:NAD(P)H-dependent oxidoreductase [Brucepastera parasyntrophica]ULQ60201.1 NAD(P)H-dependent oxidoreductase [Brucepastera parasyntrophica]
MTAQEQFASVLRRRYACRLFDTEHTITDSDIAYILDCGRLSPSSFGLEGWHFYAVISPEKKKKLYAACFMQEAVLTAGLAVVIVCRKAASYKPESSFVRERASRFPGGLDAFIPDYTGYYDYLKNNNLLDSWSRAQTYIPCTSMMIGAAGAGIDSCALEGFENQAVLEILELDPSVWDTGIICVFGYARDKTVPEKIRMPAGEITSYV